MGKFIDITNHVFGKWTVLKQGCHDRQNKIMWLCQCSCGLQRNVRGKDLRNGSSKGCQKCSSGIFRHGLSRSLTYKIWAYMIARCHNPKDTTYSNYGKRGIIVCNRWRDDFLNFLEDMGERPVDLSIDRIDNEGNYCKENCRWTDRKTQNYNKRTNVKVGHVYHGWKLLRRLEHWSKSEWECIKCRTTLIYNTSMIKTGKRFCHCSHPHPCSSSLR